MANGGREAVAAKASGGGAATGDGARAVRIGVVVGGRIVEERTLATGRDVTVGPSARDTIILTLPATAGGAPSLKLLTHTPAGYVLEARAGMRGRVVVGGEGGPERVIAVEQIARARRIGLGPRARGRIVLGDATLLFQLVAPPPSRPRPTLPASLRGSLLANVDWALVGVVALSLFAHVGFVTWLREADFPRRPAIDEVPDRFVRAAVMPLRHLELPPPAPVKPVEKPVTTTHGGPHVDRPLAPVVHHAPRPAPTGPDLRDAVSRTGLLRVLGHRGDGDAIADLLRAGAPSDDADRALRDVGGVITTSTAPLVPRSHGGDATRRTIRDLAGPAVATVDSGASHEADTGTLTFPTPPRLEEAAPGCDAERVARAVATRRRAVLSCYERALRHDPTVSGKIELRLRVSPAGLVESATLDSDGTRSDELARCVTGTASRWRFPELGCGEVELSCPFVFQRAQ